MFFSQLEQDRTLLFGGSNKKQEDSRFFVSIILLDTTDFIQIHFEIVMDSQEVLGN